MFQELDELFGKLEDPMPRSSGEAKDPWEEKHDPHSLTILDTDSANYLKRFMEDTEQGFSAGRVLAVDTTIIWVVDDRGRVRFAMEEMFHDNTPTGLAKLQNFPLTKFVRKLGHPSLLRDALSFKGRIGGEIRFESNLPDPYWSINRRSGRYGYHDDRIYVHLKNAANQFRHHGIELHLDPDF
ncbi:hypothetical protein [uncultured Roseobacter sp.]|uniref:hypothetical protein n=1 Tax=uncultured Roseobacter sp. TaxID=114847 RepID=UPI00261704C9|nr:hypothetical protein [uncultured Roseobacter sp.]